MRGANAVATHWRVRLSRCPQRVAVASDQLLGGTVSEHLENGDDVFDANVVRCRGGRRRVDAAVEAEMDRILSVYAGAGE